MATSLKLIISFIFLTTLFSMQIHARESQFFSKVSATTTTPTTPTNDKYNAKETTTIPNKEETFMDKKEEDPSFIPETQNAYGLYGSRESSSQTQFPTTTKLGNAQYTSNPTYLPYKTQTQTQETYTNYNNKDNKENYYYNNNQYNNNANYEEEQQNIDETSLQESSYTTTSNNNKYYNGYTNGEKQGMSDTRFLENGKYYYDLNGENNYNSNKYQSSRVGKQGMSDTRFLEHGKYHYDLNSENNYNPKKYQSSRVHYDNRGNYFNNNENVNYAYGNGNEMYKNQEEYEDSQDEQFQP